MITKPADISKYNFFSRLSKIPSVEAIYLYGSRARGTEDDRADVDLAIQCPNASDDEWMQIEGIIENSDMLLKIDFVRLDKLKDTLLIKEIERDKVKLYERS